MIQFRHPVERYFHHIKRYHIYCLGLMFITKVPLFWNLMSIIFLCPPMEYSCHNNGQAEIDKCPCDEPVWNRTVFTETIQTKFSLICERRWLISLSESMLFSGTLFGALVFGFLSDKYGRLFIYSVCCLSIAITAYFVTIMHTASTYIVIRFLEGIGIGGAIVTGFVYTVEYCGTRYRDIVAALYHFPISIGHITLAGISYLARHCDTFALACAIPMFFVALIWLLLYESPKWLLDKGKIDKAAKVMKKIDKCNKTSDCDTIEIEMQEYLAKRALTVHNKVNFFQIFKYKKLVMNFSCMAFIFLVCGMGYYGVSQYIGLMKGNTHYNVAISGMFLIPGTLLTTFLLRLLSRRLFLTLSNLLAGVFMIIVISIPEHMKTTRMVFASLANTFFFVSFIIIFLYGVELFPTGVRNSVLGVLSVLSRVGMIIAPPINALNATAAGAVFGIAAILGAVVCYPLPETKNIELPSTIEECRALNRPSLRHSLQIGKLSVVR